MATSQQQQQQRRQRQALAGGCLCGAIRYEITPADAEPIYSVICHCINCKKATGTHMINTSIFRKEVSVSRYTPLSSGKEGGGGMQSKEPGPMEGLTHMNSNSPSSPGHQSSSSTKPPTRGIPSRASSAPNAGVLSISPHLRCPRLWQLRAGRWMRGRRGGSRIKVCFLLRSLCPPSSCIR